MELFIPERTVSDEFEEYSRGRPFLKLHWSTNLRLLYWSSNVRRNIYLSDMNLAVNISSPKVRELHDHFLWRERAQKIRIL